MECGLNSDWGKVKVKITKTSTVVALLGSGQTLRDIGFRKENLFQAKCRGNELRRKGDCGMGNGHLRSRDVVGG